MSLDPEQRESGRRNHRHPHPHGTALGGCYLRALTILNESVPFRASRKQAIASGSSAASASTSASSRPVPGDAVSRSNHASQRSIVPATDATTCVHTELLSRQTTRLTST